MTGSLLLCAGKTPPGCKLHPGPRQWRMLHDFDNRQLPAATWVSQSIASGQASKAGHAVRKAHSEKPLDRPENEYIHFLAGHRFFLCPEALVATLKFQAQIVCSCFQASSPGWVQGPSGPWAQSSRPRRPRTSPCQISVCRALLKCSAIQQDYTRHIAFTYIALYPQSIGQYPRSPV